MSIGAKRWLSVVAAIVLSLPALLIDNGAARAVVVGLIAVAWLIVHERLRAQERSHNK